MSNEISGFALFCEDIRDEAKGTECLIGVLPQGISVPYLPFSVYKLGVYARLSISRSWNNGPIKCQLRLPSGEAHEIGVITKGTLDKIAEQTDEHYESLGVTMAATRTLELTQVGEILLILQYHDVELLIGKLLVNTA